MSKGMCDNRSNNQGKQLLVRPHTLTVQLLVHYNSTSIPVSLPTVRPCKATATLLDSLVCGSHPNHHRHQHV